jgi:hypothetical protein
MIPVIASQRVDAKAPPDDKLREAIHATAKLDCLVASLLAMTPETNDRSK